MTKTTWIIFGVIIVAVLGGLIYMSSLNRVNTDQVDPKAIQAASEANGDIAEHTKGNSSSPVVLTEYADFQCPTCSTAHPVVKALLADYGDKIGYIFRNFPLSNIHPNSKAAAAAAEAAGLQGKYWEMHDVLFERRDEWVNSDVGKRTDVFTGFASGLGLDTDRFTNDFASSNIKRKIEFDQAVGKRQGVKGTPSFFINGEALSDDISSSVFDGSQADKLRQHIDEKLKAAGVEPPKPADQS